jgi:hypothetical protein
VVFEAMAFRYYPALSELRALVPLSPELSEPLGTVHSVAADEAAASR